MIVAEVDGLTNRLPGFIEPTEPDAAPIMALHRGHDGYVTFHRRNDKGQFENCFSVPAKEISGIFPQLLAPHLETESWYSVNGYYRHGYSQSKLEPDLYMPTRRTKDLRWLTACFVDIDCYNRDLTTGQAIGALIDYQEAGIIPPASMITKSGRGVWAFWMLHDEQNETSPVRAWPENIKTYHRLQRKLYDITARIGADAQARDAARITRIPGSVHRKTGLNVAYWIQATSEGCPFQYTLAQSCALLDVAPGFIHPSVRRVIDPRLSERGKRGYNALNQKRLRNLSRLWNMRGETIHEGMRSRFCYLMSGLLHKLTDEGDMTVDEQNVMVFGIGQNSTPPLPDDEIETAWISGRKSWTQISDQTFADWFRVTPEESAQLDRCPAAREYQDPAEIQLEPTTRKEKCAIRRQLLGDLVIAGTVGTLEECQMYLEEHGSGGAPKTIAKDLEALGWKNPRAKRKGKTDNGQMALVTDDDAPTKGDTPEKQT